MELTKSEILRSIKKLAESKTTSEVTVMGNIGPPVFMSTHKSKTPAWVIRTKVAASTAARLLHEGEIIWLVWLVKNPVTKNPPSIGFHVKDTLEKSACLYRKKNKLYVSTMQYKKKLCG